MIFGQPVFIGSEPGKLAISDEGQYLYVSLDGAASVRRLILLPKAQGCNFPWTPILSMERTGQVIDPVSHTLVGRFSASGPMVPDSTVGRTFFLSQRQSGAGSWRVQAFDQETFLEIGSLDIPGVTGTPRSLIRWGADGLAFRTETQVFIFRTSLVSSPGVSTGAVLHAARAHREHSHVQDFMVLHRHLLGVFGCFDLEYTKRMKDTTTHIRLRLDRLIGEIEEKRY